jgi:phage repressor protein C with HTH and peptisase S24 domain
MDIDEIRRANIRLLEKRLGAVFLAKQAGMSPSQFYNLRDGAKDYKTGKARGMRKETAWKIEDAANVLRGFLDTPHEGLPPLPIKPPEAFVFAKYDTGGAMGHGVDLKDQPGVISEITVSQDWLSKNVKGFTSAKNLCIVTGFGDSMKGIYNPGDPLIVDTGVRSLDYDAVYFFRIGNEGFIKRLQRIPGRGIIAISENKAYQDWVINDSMDFEIFGRVVKAWESKDF